MFSLLEIENELKKRLAYPYKWGTKQTNQLDKKSNFIYKTFLFEDLLQKIESAFKDEINYKDLQNYALNRWYNFHSAMAVERIFRQHASVKKTANSKDKEKDFYINTVPFDHKTSVFPKRLNMTFNQAINDTKSVCEWLYKNQSQQGRFHLKNRLFILLFDRKGEHWKLKANLQKLMEIIENYLNNFDEKQLTKIEFAKHEIALTDIIWLIN